jgi:tetratricopeptide (TPR) repeat protein
MVDADEIYSTGWQLLQSHRLDDAAEKFKLLTESDANDHEALRALALVYIQMGRLEGARSLLERAVKRHTESPEYFTDLGDVYRGLRSQTEAKAAYQSALRLVLPNEDIIERIRRGLDSIE